MQPTLQLATTLTNSIAPMQPTLQLATTHTNSIAMQPTLQLVPTLTNSIAMQPTLQLATTHTNSIAMQPTLQLVTNSLKQPLSDKATTSLMQPSPSCTKLYIAANTILRFDMRDILCPTHDNCTTELDYVDQPQPHQHPG